MFRVFIFRTGILDVKLEVSPWQQLACCELGSLKIRLDGDSNLLFLWLAIMVSMGRNQMCDSGSNPVDLLCLRNPKCSPLDHNHVLYANVVLLHNPSYVNSEKDKDILLLLWIIWLTTGVSSPYKMKKWYLACKVVSL